MKTILAAVIGLAIASSAQAQIVMHTFDISGLASEGSFGSNFPTLTHDFGIPGTLAMAAGAGLVTFRRRR